MTERDVCPCGSDGDGESHCWVCHMSGIPSEDLTAHMRDHGYEPDPWPDGDPVIVDTTIEPGDFR